MIIHRMLKKYQKKLYRRIEQKNSNLMEDKNENSTPSIDRKRRKLIIHLKISSSITLQLDQVRS